MSAAQRDPLPPPVELPSARLAEAPRATLGCLQLPTDLTLDVEVPALVARLPGVRLRLAKLELDGDTLDVANYRTGGGRLARAAATLRPRGSLTAVGLACTSLSFTLGHEAVHAELREAHPGARVTDMASAVLAALQHLGVRRPALLTPYNDELHAKNLELLSEAGVPPVSHGRLGLDRDEDITAVEHASIVECARAVDRPEADALVLGCSAFRACTPGFLDELEETLRKPVVASLQAFLWHLLRLAGVDDTLDGYGRLLARPPS